MDKPTVEDFKLFFARDFPFQPVPFPDPPNEAEPDKYIQDSDIEKAFMLTNMKFNGCCFGEQEEYTLAYLYLAAHILTMNIRTSNSGASGTGFNWGVTSQSVGSVSIGSNIPQSIANNPQWSWLVSTNYGVEYLMMILPCTVGNFGSVPGRTHA